MLLQCGWRMNLALQELADTHNLAATSLHSSGKLCSRGPSVVNFSLLFGEIKVSQ